MDKGSGKKKKKGKGKKAGKKKKQIHTTSPAIEVLEDGIVPLFLANATQQIFNCVSDEHVSEENPYVILKKEDVIYDMKMRAAISDFTPVKQFILDYPEEELLIVYDPLFKYGQNFYICVTEESKNRHIASNLKTPSIAEIAEFEEEKVYTYQPPISKDWIDQGSMEDIYEEAITDTRSKIKYLVSRLRSQFEGHCSLTDRDTDPTTANQSLTTSYVSCRSYNDPLFKLERLVQDTSTQCVPELVDGFAQTNWRHPVNASIQCEPRTMTKEDAAKIELSKEYNEFLKDVLPRFELALQQNLITNVFVDDWKELGEEDANLGSKMDTHLKEYQSFTDLKHSKDKNISCIDWHPKFKGVIAVSCTERFNAEERIDNSNFQVGKSALILIWSFSDPINPQILLESPDEIMCFKFCPTNPDHIVGGSINGQVVLWDIKEYSEKLSNLKLGVPTLNPRRTSLFGEEKRPDIPTVRCAAVSSIENGHKNLVASVQWLPHHFEFNRIGVALENKSGSCVQIVTGSIDCNVMVWDVRPSKNQQQQVTSEKQKKLADLPYTKPTTFSHLDLQWKPLLKFSVTKMEDTGAYSFLRLSIAEKHGQQPLVEEESDDRDKVGEQDGTGPSPPSKGKVLEHINTTYFAGTEDGEVVSLDFKTEKDPESGKQTVRPPSWCQDAHDGPVVTLQRNPFCSDLILSVGGWNFCLWKEGHLQAAILQSACREKTYTAGHWSISRPGVFFLATSDGNIEAWDILEKTHEPLLLQNVTASKITNVAPCRVSTNQHFLAISDNIGTLHILEISWVLRSPSHKEERALEKFLERETKRIEYFEERKLMWTEHFERIEREIMERKKIRTMTRLSSDVDEEFEEYKVEYENYLKLEYKLLLQLGLTSESEDLLV